MSDVGAMESGEEQELYFSQATTTREKLALYLHTLASRMERGVVHLGLQEVTIPEFVAMKIELEEMHNAGNVSFELEMELTWPVFLRAE
jgi:hypothetical protein